MQACSQWSAVMIVGLAAFEAAPWNVQIARRNDVIQVRYPVVADTPGRFEYFCRNAEKRCGGAAGRGAIGENDRPFRSHTVARGHFEALFGRSPGPGEAAGSRTNPGRRLSSTIVGRQSGALRPPAEGYDSIRKST